MNIALVTAGAARALDGDLRPLGAALQGEGAHARVVDWDDATVDWSVFDSALLRSTWDYTTRLAEFLAWAERVSAVTKVLNPLPIIRWNTDKHYLADLTAADVPTVPSTFVEPGEDAARAIDAFLEECTTPEFVVKPAVGAGSRDVQRYARADCGAAVVHARRLLGAERGVLLQPYLDRVDRDGETALIFFAGQFSHAICKGAILRRDGGPTRALFAAENITPRVPDADELSVDEGAIAAIPFGTPLYARVDVIRGRTGAPLVSELELTEPSLYLSHGAGSAERFARAICEWS